MTTWCHPLVRVEETAPSIYIVGEVKPVAVIVPLEISTYAVPFKSMIFCVVLEVLTQKETELVFPMLPEEA